MVSTTRFFLMTQDYFSEWERFQAAIATRYYRSSIEGVGYSYAFRSYEQYPCIATDCFRQQLWDAIPAGIGASRALIANLV